MTNLKIVFGLMFVGVFLLFSGCSSNTEIESKGVKAICNDISYLYAVYEDGVYSKDRADVFRCDYELIQVNKSGLVYNIFNESTEYSLEYYVQLGDCEGGRVIGYEMYLSSEEDLLDCRLYT